MLVARIALGVFAAYVLLAGLAWLFQERLAFPAPGGTPPPPTRVGLSDVETVSLTMRDGTRLAGWYFPPLDRDTPLAPALLWFYGNGETIAAIWPVLRDFRPPGAALLVVDYPGYGASGGRATEAGLYEAGDLAYDALVGRPEIDRARVFVYGRSLGTTVATHVASTHPVAGLVLESPFTSARAMSRQHYALLPTFILRLRLDNLAAIRQVRAPVLVFHGTADRLVPTEMGRQVAQAAPGAVEFVLLDGAGHNDTYALGGRAYRDKVWQFLGVQGTRRLN
ncbi:MAG: alpha/beta hydrolase [Gemmatimonadales bacterium]